LLGSIKQRDPVRVYGIIENKYIPHRNELRRDI
jgi:hypothetical protein